MVTPIEIDDWLQNTFQLYNFYLIISFLRTHWQTVRFFFLLNIVYTIICMYLVFFYSYSYYGPLTLTICSSNQTFLECNALAMLTVLKRREYIQLYICIFV